MWGPFVHINAHLISPTILSLTKKEPIETVLERTHLHHHRQHLPKSQKAAKAEKSFSRIWIEVLAKSFAAVARGPSGVPWGPIHIFLRLEVLCCCPSKPIFKPSSINFSLGRGENKKRSFLGLPIGKRSGKIRTVVTYSRNWEMIQKNLDIRCKVMAKYISKYFHVFSCISLKAGRVCLVTSHVRNKNCFVKDLHWTTCGLCLQLFGKWSRKIWMVLKQSGKWEMIWKNPDSFDTVRKWEMIWKNPDSCDALRKIGNDPEKSGQLWNWKRGNSPNEPKYCRVAMLPFYPGFCTSGGPDSQIKQMLHF